MHVHDSTTATKAIVQAAEVDCAYAVLPQCRGTHDARLDSHVEIGLAEDGLWVLGHDLGEGDKFGVTGAL
jgi:hypothetical protein